MELLNKPNPHKKLPKGVSRETVIEIKYKINDKQLMKSLKIATLRAKLLNIELDRIRGIKSTPIKKWWQFWK